MDVHPPHGGIHNWRDFFTHLVTITIGLLIALGLEATAEWFHHRHLVAEATDNIRAEMISNQKHLTDNLARVKADEERIAGNLKVLTLIRSGRKLTPETSMTYRFDWSDLGDSAWKTAQTSGAMSYFDFKSEQDLAGVYELQQILSSHYAAIAWDHTLALSPILITNDPEKMTPQETQLVLQRTADLAANLKLMEQLLDQLRVQYKEELAKL